MTADEQQELHDLAELYAVGALTPEQDAAFSAHLDTCPECRALVADYLETLVDLVPRELQVPTHVRTDVLARIRDLPQVPREQTQQDTTTAEATASTAAPSSTPSGAVFGQPGPIPATDVPNFGGAAPSSSPQIVPATGRPRPESAARPRRGARARFVALGAGLALAASLGAFAVIERPWEGPDEAERIGSVVAASDARSFQQESDGGTVTVVVSPSQGTAVLTAEDLPPVASGEVYQAWWIDAQGEPVSAGTLSSASDARSVTLLSGSAQGAVTVAVTVEPDGGSKAPTTEPISAVDVS